MLVLFHAALSRRDFAGAEELVQLAPDIEGGDEFLSAFSTRGISLAKLKALPGLPPSWSSTLRGRRADGESGLATIRFDDARQAFEQLSNLCAEAESAHAIKEEVARLETSATGGIDSSRYPARLRAVLSEVQDRSQDAKRFAAQGEFGKATAVGRGAKDILEDNGDALRQARRVILAFIDADARLDQCLADAKTSYNTSEAFQPLAAAAETYSNYAEHHEYDVGSLQFAKRIVQAVTDTDTALKEMTSAERLQQPVEVFGHGEKAKSSLQLLRNLRVTAYATDAKLAEIGRAMDKARKAVGNEAERILAAARKAKEASDFTLLRMPLDAYTDLMGKLREPLAIEAKIYREQLDTYDKAAIEMRNGLAAVGRDDYGRAVGLLTGALELYGRIGVASHSNSINQKIALCTALTNLERAENALRTCGNAAEVAMQEMAVDEIRRACRTKVAADDVEVVEQRSRRISASAAAYKVKIRQERQRFEADSATRRARYAVAKRLAISEFTRIKDKATAVQRLRRKRQRCNELKSLANTLQVERGIYSKLIAGDVAVRNAADAADNYLRLKRQSYCNTILPPP
jgi:hypothetical protein